ncbi:MAG: peptidase U32 family protein, partial [Gammaproteobacteria bacterium]
MRQKIELLAPCGGWEPLRAVIEAGADAVYFSEKRFAMRQHGDWLNFTREELEQAVGYARERGVKSYITVNNLLTQEELALLDEHLLYLDAIRPDAIIIQDLGLLKRIRELDISTDIHASTMMNVHHSHGAEFLKRHGIKRIITSRDISIHQAAEMSRNTGLEVEYFLHGDMCVAQGSQCYHSGIASEMSANRGKCLKSCRWQWSLIDRDTNKILGHVEDQYVLARKDMCLYHQLPELIGAGIASLKIEGRARPADYLRPIVSIYREAIDRYYDDPSAYSTDFDALARLRSKTLREIGTSHAFYTPNVGSSGLSGKREPRIFSIAVEERPYRT